jgi:biotin carboxylase
MSNPSGPRLMVINAGWEQVDLIEAAVSQGYWVLASDASQTAPGLALAHATLQAEPRDIPTLLAAAQAHQVNGLVADQCDYSHYAAAFIAQQLGLPGPGLTAVQNATNKKWMRQACAKAGIQQPVFYACHTLAQAQDASATLGYPVMVKPLDNRGNFGASQVETPEQLAPAFYDAIAHAHSRECLVEQFITGTMITVDGFVFSDGSHHPLAVASKVMLGGRKRVAMTINYPAQVPDALLDSLKANHNQVVKALNLGHGCTHAEYMLTDTGDIYLIECANRGGGVFTSSRIVPTVSGYPVSAMLVDLAMGHAVLPEKSRTLPVYGACVLRFFQLQPGVIQAIQHQAAIEQHADVLAFRLSVQPGDSVAPIVTDAGRHGFVIARGNTLAEAEATAQWAIDTLKVVYTPSQKEVAFA